MLSLVFNIKDIGVTCYKKPEKGTLIYHCRPLKLEDPLPFEIPNLMLDVQKVKGPLNVCGRHLLPFFFENSRQNVSVKKKKKKH